MKALQACACGAALLAASLLFAAWGRPAPAVVPEPAPPAVRPPVVPFQPTANPTSGLPPPIMGGNGGDDVDNNGGPNDGDGNK